MDGFEYLFEWKILFIYLFVFPFINADTISSMVQTQII